MYHNLVSLKAMTKCQFSSIPSITTVIVHFTTVDVAPLSLCVNKHPTTSFPTETGLSNLVTSWCKADLSERDQADRPKGFQFRVNIYPWLMNKGHPSNPLCKTTGSWGGGAVSIQTRTLERGNREPTAQLILFIESVLLSTIQSCLVTPPIRFDKIHPPPQGPPPWKQVSTSNFRVSSSDTVLTPSGLRREPILSPGSPANTLCSLDISGSAPRKSRGNLIIWMKKKLEG